MIYCDSDTDKSCWPPYYISFLSLPRISNEVEGCQTYVYPNFEFEETTVTKFNLLCDNTDFVKSVSATETLPKAQQTKALGAFPQPTQPIFKLLPSHNRVKSNKPINFETGSELALIL